MGENEALIQSRLSTSLEDPNWDDFLQNTRNGHYEQTSLWARIKLVEGWHPIRVIFLKNKQIIAGFQILKRCKFPFGNIGYISKGPVVKSNDAQLKKLVIERLQEITKENRIRMLIIQPPDNSADLSSVLFKLGFLPNCLIDLINATVILDVRKNLDVLEKSLKRQKRQNIRRGLRSGLTMKEGNKNELSLFFEFMLETCKRQGVSPHPAKKESLTKMWELLYPRGLLKLFMVELCGEEISGILAIPFRDSLFLWKFGWSGKYGKLRPNDFLFWETIKWAKNHGYSYVNFLGVDSEAKQVLKESGNVADHFRKTSTFFKLAFGGELVFLPEARVYIYNPIIKWAYKNILPIINSNSWLSKKITSCQLQ
ncbi:MAG: peptidoglycan bridge formation glycyltransferase FemA/FemB family protein [Calditrichaeota bacterium]|nr:peptidoglycan bridge formation glycyltransferase FemA/FemB family protein [Calditrichota bacterium]